MRRTCLAVLATFFALSSVCSYGFTFSPTQTPGEPVTRTAPKQISQKLVSGILADQNLVKGVEMLAPNKSGDGIETLQGDLSDPISGDLEKESRNFIFAHSDVFNVPSTRDDNLMKLVKSVEAAGANHFYYQMNLNGVPVYDSIIDVHVGSDKRIQLANGSFPTIKEISNQISINRLDAIAAAQRAVGIKSIRGVPKADMVVFPQDGKDL